MSRDGVPQDGTIASAVPHVPLYLKWAPVGIFSGIAPQRKDQDQEAPVKSAEKNVVEPEMCKNKSMWEETRAVR